MKSTDRSADRLSQQDFTSPEKAAPRNERVGIKKEVVDRLSGKETKQQVNYRHAPKGALEVCGNCTYFNEPASCSRVAGAISTKDVCDRFAER